MQVTWHCWNMKVRTLWHTGHIAYRRCEYNRNMFASHHIMTDWLLVNNDELKMLLYLQKWKSHLVKYLVLKDSTNAMVCCAYLTAFMERILCFVIQEPMLTMCWCWAYCLHVKHSPMKANAVQSNKGQSSGKLSLFSVTFNLI